MPRRLLGTGFVAGALVLTTVGATPPVAAQDQVTMVIGVTQPWETLNPVVGYAVSEYEFWNIQYAGLTARAADDYAPEPGLAESWVEDEPGSSYTYTLRDDLQWSDGTPITADDIAWTVNTARDQEWTNYVATVENLTAEVVDEHTVTITSSVPDPKLPSLEVYPLPRHIWEEQATPETIDTYEALDGVGSGPFVLDDYQSEESLTMVANDHYYGGRPAVDRIIFRYFSNPDAMVAALQRGEIDAANDLPAASIESLRGEDDIEVIVGFQGGFDELAFNGGKGAAEPHPALLDHDFRVALNHAIDKVGATEDLWFGLAEPATTVSFGADFKWIPDIPEDEQLTYDPDLANQLLDEAGYVDTDGNGIREMPGGGDDIVLRHAVNTDEDLAQAVGELWSGWMNAVGIGVELDAHDQDTLSGVIADGDYDTFYWGWVPYVDPNPLVSYFTEAEIGGWNDANWWDPRYEEIYVEQQQELDPGRRLELLQEAARIIYDDAAYPVLWYGPDLQAYRTDRFEGFVRQPAEVGPVIFSQSSPSYALLRPVGGEPSTGGSGDATGETTGEAPAEGAGDATGGTTGDAAGAGTDDESPADVGTVDDGASDDGDGNGVTIAIVIVAVVVVLGLGGFAVARRRKSVDERE